MRTNRRTSQSSFVLLAVLLVVSLLTILLVASVVLAQIELQASYNAAKMELARQNALFGLNEALNQLQDGSGQDQRTTARADILTNITTAINPTALGYFQPAPATDSGQAYWTGVWRNNTNDYIGTFTNTSTQAPNAFLAYDYDAAGNPVTTRTTLYNNANVNWLVSWPYGQTANIPDPTANLNSGAHALANSTWTTSGNTVTYQGTVTVPLETGLSTTNIIAGAVNTMAGQTNTVSAPVVPIMANRTLATAPQRVGSFAYWISDNGIKAKVTVPDPYLAATSTYGQTIAHYASCQAPAVAEGLTSTSELPGVNDVRTTVLTQFCPNLASMTYVDNTYSTFSTTPNLYSPDFTTDSFGVIADNFNGGLRQDLTTAFENPSLYQSTFGHTEATDTIKPEAFRKIYSLDAILGTTTTSPVNNFSGANPPEYYELDGLRWDSLFLYYNVYKQNMPSPLFSNLNQKTAYPNWSTSPANGNVPTLNFRAYYEYGCGASGSGNLCIDPIMPKVVSYGQTMGMMLTVPGGTPPPNSYNLQLIGAPYMVLYNPFNVNLSAPPSAANKFPAIEVANNIGGMDSWTINIASSIQGTVSIGPLNFGDNGYNRDSCFPASGTDPAITPGEFRLYALPGTTPIAVTQSYEATAWNATPTPPPPPTPTPVPATSFIVTTASQGFASRSNQMLVSQNIATVNGAYQSIYFDVMGSTSSPTSFSFQASTTDPITIVGGTRLRNNTDYISMPQGYSWPNATGQSNNWNFAQTTQIEPIGSPNFGDWVSRTASFGTVGNFVNTEQLFGTFLDRFYGFSSPSNIVDSTSGTYAYTPNPEISPPLCAYGLNWLSPYSSSLNRDLATSFVDPGSVTAPSQEYQAQSVGSGATAATDTCWGPNSVGRPDPSYGSFSNNQVPLKDLPFEPMISIGQFRNLFINYNYGYASPQTLTMSFNPVGGSYQGGLGSKYVLGYNANQAYLDDNFLANEVLFDSYFFSTVPPATVAAGDLTAWPITVTATGISQAYVTANQPLPNSRLIYYFRAGNPDSPAGTIAPSITDLQVVKNVTNPTNLRLPAANLLINGAFNINSTSVSAWVAQLSGLSGCKVSVQAFNGMTSSSSSIAFSSQPGEVPFFNFLHPVASTSSSSPLNATGSRSAYYPLLRLTSAEIQTLASQIVTQIMTRGPAFTLGDFLNRRLGAADNILTTAGPLQAAIDATPINNTVLGTSSVLGSTSTGSQANGVAVGVQTIATMTTPAGLVVPHIPVTGDTPKAGMGLPGTLTQWDLVQAIAPFIAARSDTFTVRAYGDAVNPATGAVDAKCWCEATLQRVPEYEYSTEAGLPAATSNYSYADPATLYLGNYAFGRRYKIVSFRWLNASQI